MALLGTGQLPVPKFAGSGQTPDAARAGTLSYMMAQPVSMPPNPTAPYNPPAPQTFGGSAPAPTPYGTFTAPDPTQFEHSPDYQYLLGEQAKASQRSAGARGTLLSGGFLKSMQRDAAGIAAGDYQNAYNRALGAYNTNRETNQQNFGQQMGQFQGNLGAFNANVNSDLGYGRLGLEAQQNQFGQDRIGALDRQSYQQQLNDYNAYQGDLSQQRYDQQQNQYAQEVERQRAFNNAQANGQTSVQQQQVGQALMSRARPLSAYGYGGTLNYRGRG